MSKHNIVILGSTGSIGINTLDVIQRFSDKFNLIGIAAGSNIEVLKKQIDRFKPEFAAVYNTQMADQLRRRCRNVGVFSGIEGLCRLASLKQVDTVVICITGSVALLPLLEAIKFGKRIALASKETLVVAGHIVREQLRRNSKAQIIPIDSEQNAIFQCLRGYNRNMVSSLYLTASGGPLINYKRDNLAKVSPQEALSHPRWKMGRKISIDSATLMNKGLEVIEAKWLFDIALEQIKVVIHKEAIVHSLVEFIDGSILGQLGVTDMRLPIQYALSFPERWYNNGQLKLNLIEIKSLTFSKPNFKKFPCLGLAYYAASGSDSLPCVLNAANDEAVNAFLNHQIGFMEIPNIIEKLLKEYFGLNDIKRLQDLLKLEGTVRIKARELIQRSRDRK